ncbi:ABC transporter ATP-binding protein/permease [Prosthecochloris sp. SCSIO W1101]|uniref:ABC transporter ATP-binding protein n=1 Tax=Prosthecochloris sp. SCSIO W1101 TaxID=2992242 RepID=UPI00223E11CC|nr:ABC transporter ATP-binding protein [Prosthecochloris sp. SCSIO W1101]UZJ40692.1 ABC transporter ATP-binding protein/permease [Prosthecochloris sp. SCSIO W1101]
MRNDKKKSGIARLLELSGQKKGLLLVSFVTGTVHVLLTMVPYILIFYILTELLNGRVGNPNIAIWLIWAFVAIVISAVMLYGSGMAAHIAAFNILYGLRCKITDKLGRLPMGYLGGRSSGALKKIVADDVELIELFIAHSLPDAVRAIMLPLVILGYLFMVDWRLAIVSLLPILILAIAVPVLSGSDDEKAKIKKYHDSLEEMNAGIVEFVRAMPMMKIFGQSATAFARYSDTVKEFDCHVRDWTRLTAPLWAMIISFLTNAQLPLLAFGLYLFFSGGLDLPVFFLFLILGVGYIRPAFKLTSVNSEVIKISQGVRRMDEILFDVEEQKSGSAPVPTDFALEFRNARFSYVDGIDVIKDVNFKVPQGTITALVGPSGSGKSTAGQLIARFYDLNSGSITLGGVNINDLSIEDLMKHVGFVFQDNMMFQQSILDNILMGMDKTKQEVVAAAKTARCHDFIMQLPDGYETLFGGKGVHLSGGEQQRIQLARVVLKDAPVLVLDEATAFSDPENEHLIMAAISELIQQKTVIIIAHRLSTVADVDQIVVLDNGEVEAVGTHGKLLGKSALYSKMWNAHQRANEFEIVNA